MKLNDKIEEYYKKFKEYPAIMPTLQLTDEELITELDKCIKDSKVYEFEMEEGKIY